VLLSKTLNGASVLSLRLVDFAEAYASPEAAGRWDAVVTEHPSVYPNSDCISYNSLLPPFE